LVFSRKGAKNAKHLSLIVKAVDDSYDAVHHEGVAETQQESKLEASEALGSLQI
jgi:hypothetical protein